MASFQSLLILGKVLPLAKIHVLANVQTFSL